MFKESKNRMNVLSEKHLQTLKKQTKDVNATEHRRPPDKGSHRSQTVTGHRQPLTIT